MSRIAAVLALTMFLVAQPVGAQTPEFEVDHLVGPRGFCCGNGIALVGDDLYVNHAALDGIDIVDVNTAEVTPIASEADDAHDELVTPDDIWIDPDTGDMYITEILTNGVRRIAPDGTRTRVMTGFGDGVAHPNAITGLRRPGEDLRLFISMVQFEPGSQTGIWEIDPDGIFPPKLVYGAVGGRVIHGHGMRAPNAFAFDPDGQELFVPESYGGAVWAVDVDAHTARPVYTPDTHGPAETRPNGIALRFARDGSILYAEQDTGRLLRLDPAGPPEQTPDVVAHLDPGIDGIAEHADGRIFLSNFRYGGIHVVHPDGTTGNLFDTGLDLPNAIDRFDDGRIAVGDLGSLATVDPGTGAIDRPKQFIRDDFDIAVGVGTIGDCDAYATGFFRGTLQHTDVCDPSAPHTEIVPRKTFAFPWDVAAGAENELWVSDVAGLVWRLSGVDAAASATALPVPGAFAEPTGIAYERGRVYVSESKAGLVRVLDASTGLPTRIIDGLDEPEGVGVDPCDGAVYVVEAGAGRLVRILPNGSRDVVLEGLATDVRGVSVVPVLNFFADVDVRSFEILVTSPVDGSITRLRRTADVRACAVPGI